MALNTTVTKETITIGKGRTKKDLVIVHVENDIVSENIRGGAHMKASFETGASSDDTFGLRLVSMQGMFRSDSVFAASDTGVALGLSVGLVSASDDETGVPALNNQKVLSSVSSDPVVIPTNCRALVPVYAEFVPDNTRIVVLKDVHLDCYASATPATLNAKFNARFVFEKVSVTKQEYLDKMIRNI